MPSRTLAACRACAAPVEPVLDLGRQPAMGAFAPTGDPSGTTFAPLRFGICNACGLAQLEGDGPDEDDDPNAPSPTSSATMAAHARGFVAELAAPAGPSRDRRVLELASHGGHLRPFFREAGVATTVLERSEERATRLAEDGADVFLDAAFGTDDGTALQGAAAFDLVVDHYLLAHVPRPAAAVAALADLVAVDGTLVLEFDHLLPTVAGLQFDAIRHGHHSYLTLSWVQRELGRHRFRVVRATPQPVYGGALRVWARPGAETTDPGVARIVAAEAAAGLGGAAGFTKFVAGVDEIRRATVAHLTALREAGRPAVGYGAPARGVTFLNALGIGPDLLEVTADRATAKHGHVIAGVGVPIVAPEDLRERTPTDVLVLTWDLAAEIRSGAPWVEERGGRFIVAVPELAVVGEDGRHAPINPGDGVRTGGAP